MNIEEREKNMAKSVIVKFRKINSVKNNIAYLKDKKEHPETCMHYSTCDNKLWMEYAEKNQEEFLRSGQKGKCVEAHEMIFVFPNEFYSLDQEERFYLIKKFAEIIKTDFNVDVFVALHAADKDANNMHVHLMYMERRQIKEKEKIATRKTWIEAATGKKIRTKKEAYENGKLKSGVIEYQKGEVIKSTKWTAKDEYLRSNKFTHETKVWWAKQLNGLSKHYGLQTEKRVVFDGKNNPYFGMSALRHPLKYKDKDKQERSNEQCRLYNRPIVTTNNFKSQYNRLIAKAIEMQKISPEEALEKKKGINKKIKELCLKRKKEEIKGLFEVEVRELRKIVTTREKDITAAIKEFEEKTNFEIPQMSEMEKLELELYELKEKLETKSSLEKLNIYKEIARVENKIKELNKGKTTNRQELGRER